MSAITDANITEFQCVAIKKLPPDTPETQAARVRRAWASRRRKAKRRALIPRRKKFQASIVLKNKADRR